MSDSGNRRDIELRIRATQEGAGFQQTAASIELLRANLNKAEAASASAAAKLAEYRAALEAAGETSKRAEAQLARLVATTERQEAALNSAKSAVAAAQQREQQAADQRLADFNNANLRKQLSTSLNEFNQGVALRAAAEQEKKQSIQRVADLEKDASKKAVENARFEIRERTAAGREQNRLALANLASEKAANAERIKGAEATYAAINRASSAKGAAAPVLAFGLKPYELVNLSYQLNDVVSGIAQGQNLLQIFAQQAGQFFQIFGTKYITPIFSFVKSFWKEMAVGAAAATVAIVGLIEAFRSIDTVREFNALLKLGGDGARYNAEAMGKLATEIRQLGISFEDTDKILRQSVGAGLNADRIKDFTEAAQKLSDIKGVPVVDVFKDLVAAAKGGVDGIVAFERQYHVLDETELKNIKTQEDAVRAINTIIIKSKELTGTLSVVGQAERDTTKAWNEFRTSLGETGAELGLAKFLTNEVIALRDFIDTIKAAINLLDVWRKKQGEATPASKALSPEIGSLAELKAALRGEAAPGVATQGTGTTWKGLHPEDGGMFTAKGLKIDTDELKKAVDALSEASTKAGLPPGYSVQAISTERPGAVVAGKGTQSEHAVGKAIDVQIVDANGQPILGSMGTKGPKVDSTGMYAKLDAAFEEVFKSKFPDTNYSIGTRFPNSDPGHYGVGGREAANQAAKEGRAAGGQATAAPSTVSPVTPTPIENKESKDRVRDRERELQIQYDSNEASTRAAAIAVARTKAEKETKDITDQERLIAIDTEKFDAGRRERETEFQNRLAALKISDGKNAEAIAQKGLEFKEKALASALVDQVTGTKLITLEQLRTAEIQGQDEARKKIAKDEQSDEAVRQGNAIKNQSDRDAALKSATDQAKAEQAVNDKYDTRVATLQHLLKLHPERAAALTANIAGVEADRTTELGQAKVGAFIAQGNEALKTRNELIQSYNLLAESGELSIADKQQKTAAAFDLVRTSSLAAADGIEQYLKSTEGLKETPGRIALLTAQMELFRAQTKYVNEDYKGLRKTIEESFATGVNTAFNTVGEAIGGLIAKTKSWKDVWVSLRAAAGEFFAGILKDMAAYIIKAEAMKLLDTGGSGGEGIAGKIAGLFFSSGKDSTGGGSIDYGGGGDLLSAIFHSGGVVGQAFNPRPVTASWFANAPRYHSGNTVVGLAPDEQAAILQRGEEVLSRSSPRNIMNGGGGGAVNIRNVMVFDETQIPSAMAGAHGERTTMAHIVKNAATIRQLVK